jgi:hypothetical protein
MSRNYDEEAAPKPYDFVPLAEPAQTETVGHERLHGQGYNSGRLTYQLRALSPVFVASGIYALRGEDLAYTHEPVVRACYRVDGQAAIPGSSLKGVVRSVLEAVSPSCVSITRIQADLIPFVPRERWKQREQGCKPERACPACSIFGMMGRMSKVTFGDARLVKGAVRLYRLPALYGPRTRPLADIYLKDGQVKGRKFYHHGRPAQDEDQPPVEAIKRGSLLRGELQFENLSDAELGLLIFSLSLDASFALKLGGGKPSCLGSLRVQPGRLELFTQTHFLQAEPVGEALQGEEMIEVLRKRLMAAYEANLILIEQRDKLREILRYPHDRDCPAGMY